MRSLRINLLETLHAATHMAASFPPLDVYSTGLLLSSHPKLFFHTISSSHLLTLISILSPFLRRSQVRIPNHQLKNIVNSSTTSASVPQRSQQTFTLNPSSQLPRFTHHLFPIPCPIWLHGALKVSSLACVTTPTINLPPPTSTTSASHLPPGYHLHYSQQESLRKETSDYSSLINNDICNASAINGDYSRASSPLTLNE